MGNIVANPIYLDTVMCFLIDTLSTCVDAGNPDPLYNDPPNDLIPDITFYPSHATVLNDIGVYGGPDRMQITDCPDIIPRAFIQPGHLY